MIVLDTHALVWWAAGDKRLSRAARTTIAAEQKAAQAILLSTISIWEIAMLVDRKRILLTMEIERWLELVYQLQGLRVAPITAEQAIAAVRLPGEFHRDPADRFIVALARLQNAKLITADRRIRDYPHVQSVW